MVCPACGNLSRGLCRRCAESLRPAPIRMVCGVAVVGGYAHRGAAVSLVHRMKYRRDRSATRVLVERMASVIDTEPVALVPIPRAWVRRVRYGIDPALALATGLSAHMGFRSSSPSTLRSGCRPTPERPHRCGSRERSTCGVGRRTAPCWWTMCSRVAPRSPLLSLRSERANSSSPPPRQQVL